MALIVELPPLVTAPGVRSVVTMRPIFSHMLSQTYQLIFCTLAINIGLEVLEIESLGVFETSVDLFPLLIKSFDMEDKYLRIVAERSVLLGLRHLAAL